MKTKEKSLVSLSQAGDSDAFGELVKSHHKRVYFTVLKYVRNPEVASDVVQISFLDAWKYIKNFRGESTFFTWVIRIAINNSKKSLIKQQKDPEKVGLDKVVVGEDSQVVNDIFKKQKNKILKKAIGRLTPRQQTILNLRVYEDLSFKEIAKVVGCEESSAKSHYHHIKDLLKRSIEEIEKETNDGKNWT